MALLINLLQHDWNTNKDIRNKIFYTKVNCRQCDKLLELPNYEIRKRIRENKNGIFCSKRCGMIFRGPLSKESQEKVRLSQLGISVPSRGRKGKIIPLEVREKIRLSHIGKIGMSNEKHPMWKGDQVGLFGLHRWINRHLPKKEKCEFCNLKPPRDLANITGNYNRDFDNWKRLCRSCHLRYDYEHGFRYSVKWK